MAPKKRVTRPPTQSESTLTPRAKSASGGSGKRNRDKLKSKRQRDAEIEEGKEAQDPVLAEMDSNLSNDSPSEQIASLTANSASANSATLSSESVNVDVQPIRPLLQRLSFLGLNSISPPHIPFSKIFRLRIPRQIQKKLCH
jgi:hypothetical protein